MDISCCEERRLIRRQQKKRELLHLVIWGIPYANTYGIPRNSAEFREKSTIKIPRNSAKFRGIPCVFQKFRIPPEVQKALPWTPYSRVAEMRNKRMNLTKQTDESGSGSEPSLDPKVCFQIKANRILITESNGIDKRICCLKIKH